MRGPYTLSRQPMDFSELILMLRWVIFYASVVILVALVAWFLFFNYCQMPLDENILEAHFGVAYCEYKKKVPPWSGNIKR